MTLDEAITSCMEVVSEEMEQYREICPTTYVVSPTCTETAAMHSQLAEWLIELKQRRKQPEVRHGRWILERTPDGTPYCLHCSECDPDFAVMYNRVATDYCPDCGAEMETDMVYERDDYDGTKKEDET